MAFVPPTASALRLSSFTQRAIDTKPRRAKPVGPKCMAEEGEESPAVALAGRPTLWKETIFAGGFPGGELFFQKWVDRGMKDDVPDMPKSLQSSSAYKPVVPKKKGILPKLEKLEFFKNLPEDAVAIDDAEEDDEGIDEGVPMSVPATVVAPVQDDTPEGVLNTEVPDESLYAPYFPKETRFLAPDISFEFPNDDEYYNRVAMCMTEVTASPIDVYYPKDVKNHAPVIDIFYPGYMNTASLRVTVEEIEPLPTLPPTPAPGDAVTTLVPGAGGGLKLNYEICGGETIPL